MNLSLEAIADSVEGRLDGPCRADAVGYSIDSRSIKPGELFFAIQGPRFDGHDFIGEAARAGAVGAVVSDSLEGADVALPLIRVGSTTLALQTLARAVRRRWGGTLIGVTGSVGKTTTKEMVARVLDRGYRVLRSMANLNNEYGLPLSLLGIQPQHDIAVMEMGMSARGEIRKLASIAEPNEGIVTNVNPVHLEFFTSIEEIAVEKSDLIKGLVGNRRAYLNDDDFRVRAMSAGFQGEVVTYGTRSGASFVADGIECRGLDGVRFTVGHAGDRIDFQLPLLGVHNVSNALAAISVGATHGVGWSDIQEAVRATVPAKRRGEVHGSLEGLTLIDDSYNSSPAALIEMIRLLGGLEGFRRRILVAGEMLELGDESRKLHAECGSAAFEAGIDNIVAVQGEAVSILDGARTAGRDPSRLLFVPDAAGATRHLMAEDIGAGDVVLIKGSRGVGLDQVADALKERFSSPVP